MPLPKGRTRGSLNKRTIAAKEALALSGLTPIDYMLSVMRDEKAPRDVRMDAARSVAPYVHPKLAAIEHKGPADGPIQVIIKGSDKGLL